MLDGKNKKPDSTNPAELFIFFVNEKSGNKYFPDYNTIKENFESGKNQYYYRSLIEKNSFDHTYSLTIFNEQSDRIYLFGQVDFAFSNLRAMSDTSKVHKTLEAPIRFNSREEFDNHVEEEMVKIFAEDGLDYKALKEKSKNKKKD